MKLFSLLIKILVACMLVVQGAVGKINDNSSFDQNYYVSWGYDHVLFFNKSGREEVQLTLDFSSGSGFESKLAYNSGFFRLRMKLPDKNTAGVITAFYLTSSSSKHDELDFEFLGNKKGKPYTLQTNVFSSGKGNREQRFLLWFDPTADFHSYGILWNEHQIVFYVDKIPIRVYKNNTKKGVSYPEKAMKVEASLWNGESWATDGGQTKTNWTNAPFKAYFQGFKIDGCSSPSSCSSSNYWWNREKYSKLSSGERRLYEDVRKKYMNYDYCTDNNRFPTPPLECSLR